MVKNEYGDEDELQPHPWLVKQDRIFDEHPAPEDHCANGGWPGDDVPELFLHQQQLLRKDTFGRLFFPIGLCSVDEQPYHVKQARKPANNENNVKGFYVIVLQNIILIAAVKVVLLRHKIQL